MERSPANSGGPGTWWWNDAGLDSGTKDSANC
jgi:hypothetical protein